MELNLEIIEVVIPGSVLSVLKPLIYLLLIIIIHNENALLGVLNC